MKNKNKVIAIVVAVLVVVLAVAALVMNRGQQAQPTGADIATETPEITATPEVTEEPTEAPTEEPTAEPTEVPTEEPADEATDAPAEEPEAEPAGEPEAQEPETELNPDDVMALINGEAINRGQLEEYETSLINYLAQMGYDMTNADNLSVAGSIALDTIVQDTIINQKAIDLGLDLTDEERAQAEADNAAEWAQAVDYYVANYFGITAESTEEEAADARVNALALLESMGYTESAMLDSAIASLKFEKVYAYMVQGAEVTEADIQALFNEHVAEDQANYENDIGYYEFQTQYYGNPSYYTPAGYRGVTHILLEVEQALLDEWQALTARLEEQQDEVEAGDVDLPAEPEAEAADSESTEAPVTQEQVDAAYAAIIASVQPTIDEIMAKLESGTPFADLVAEYGADPGMTVEPNKSEGYPVHMDSIIWDPAFVAGAFSVDEVGAVAEPVVGSYGVHIIQYTRDVPSGAVALTDEIRATLTDEALEVKESELYQSTMETWLAESEIVYSDEAQAIRQSGAMDEEE